MQKLEILVLGLLLVLLNLPVAAQSQSPEEDGNQQPQYEQPQQQQQQQFFDDYYRGYIDGTTDKSQKDYTGPYGAGYEDGQKRERELRGEDERE